MRTFDQCLFDLHEAGKITYEEALRHADSQNELRLRIKLESKRINGSLKDDDEVAKLSILEEEDEGEPALKRGRGEL